MKKLNNFIILQFYWWHGKIGYWALVLTFDYVYVILYKIDHGQKIFTIKKVYIFC